MTGFGVPAGRFRLFGKTFRTETEPRKKISTRCYGCAFYGLFCLDKRRDGIIPECEAEKRADGMNAFFVEDKDAIF